MSFNDAIAKVADAARKSPVVVVGLHGSGKCELARRAAESLSPEKPACVNVTVMDAVVQYPFIRDSRLFMLEYSRLADVNPGQPLVISDFEASYLTEEQKTVIHLELLRTVSEPKGPVFLCALSEDNVPDEVLSRCQVFFMEEIYPFEQRIADWNAARHDAR